jgi:hypothetical protein
LFQRRDIGGDFRHGLEDLSFFRMRIGTLDAARRPVFGQDENYIINNYK